MGVLIPVDRAGEEEKILARISRGEAIRPYETVRQKKDGTLLNVSLSVSPIKDASGAVVGASKIARDESVAPAVREKMAAVRLNVELEARLIDDLLDSTRIATGKLPLYRTVIDANEMIHRAVTVVEG